MEINSGITKIVHALNSAGFQTTDSGDGETHDYECDRPYGYIVVVIPDKALLVPEADRLAAVLTELGITPVPMAEDPPNGHCWIHASYDPTNGIALIDVSYVHDRMLRREYNG